MGGDYRPGGRRACPVGFLSWLTTALDRPAREHRTHQGTPRSPDGREPRTARFPGGTARSPGPPAARNPPPPQRALDPEFTALPLHHLADAALQQARDLGAEHADFRLERVRAQYVALSDNHLETLFDADELGLAVRVICDGTWGFAASADLTPEAAARAAAQAVDVAKVSAAINRERIELADEPAHGEVTWISSYLKDPFEISVTGKVALLREWGAGLLADNRVDHVDVRLQQVKECKFYCDGVTTASQQRVRLHPVVTAVAVDGQSGRFDTMRTNGPPAGRGYEYLTGTGWDFAAEIAELPELLAAKLAAPSVQAGAYDLVIHPSNLWLAIHESIGHATELDRALGYEAAYAGTSFATPDKLGSLRYGSPVMHVTGDRTAEHGLATVGFDDEGVAAQTLGHHLWRDLHGLPARSPDGENERLRAVQRLRLRRLTVAHATAADGQRLAASGSGRPGHRGPDRRRRTRHLHSRRQQLVHRHAAVQLPVHRPALLQDRERSAGRPAP